MNWFFRSERKKQPRTKNTFRRNRWDEQSRVSVSSLQTCLDRRYHIVSCLDRRYHRYGIRTTTLGWIVDQSFTPKAHFVSPSRWTSSRTRVRFSHPTLLLLHERLHVRRWTYVSPLFPRLLKPRRCRSAYGRNRVHGTKASSIAVFLRRGGSILRKSEPRINYMIRRNGWEEEPSRASGLSSVDSC